MAVVASGLVVAVEIIDVVRSVVGVEEIEIDVASDNRLSASRAVVRLDKLVLSTFGAALSADCFIVEELTNDGDAV